MTVNPIDLTTVAVVASWLGSAISGPQAMAAPEQDNVQRCITAASLYWLWRTGQWSAATPVPAKSPFVEVVDYDEWYDGNSGPRLFVQRRPVRSVSKLAINGIDIPASTDPLVPGYVIDQSGKSIALRGSTSGRSRFYGRVPLNAFCAGIQNVHVVYAAGFSGTPPDINLACTQMVALNYKRRQWIDQSSQSMANGAGTVSFQEWELPPEVVSVMNNYSRVAA